jgi:asparagine synthase (glutamine-hydrolysing)
MGSWEYFEIIFGKIQESISHHAASTKSAWTVDGDSHEEISEDSFLMCGICGFLESRDMTEAEEDRKCLTAMCREMEHRGPDDMGIYAPGTGIGLGAVRLSIIDLAGGHQPLPNEDGSVWVVLNGEIYGFLKVRQQLQQLGHHFVTQCDTEVVVHAYEEWGVDCVNHLDGMFAFAIWDNQLKQLFIARDRLGKKPLYYFYQNNNFVFASEIKSLLKRPAKSSRLDQIAVDMFLTFAYVPGPATIYQDIKKLLPGHWMMVDEQGQMTIRQYWDLCEPNPDKIVQDDEEKAQTEILRLLENSVKARLLADVPIGVFLSGGLDSSVVTAVMRKYKLDKLKSFSVSFYEKDHNEAPYARLVANHLGTEHYELAANQCSPELLQKLVWHSDEPLGDPAIVPTYLVSKFAREHVTVVLTGEGADELFAGYFYYPLEQKAAKIDWMPGWMKRSLLVHGAKTVNRVIGRLRYHPRTIWSWQLEPHERFLAWMSIFSDEEKHRWFTPHAKAISDTYPSARFLDSISRPYRRDQWFSNFCYVDLKVPLVDDLLMKGDKMSMAASLEARCPFLDFRLVEYVSSLPVSYKLSKGQNKLILRKIAAGLLPGEITDRKKHGFDVPIKRWLTGDLRTYFWDIISSQNFNTLEIINRPEVEEIWSEMEADVPNRTRQLWSLLILATWINVMSS